MKQSAKIIPYKRDEKLYPPYDTQKKADGYQFSLDKSRAILLSIFCAAIGVLLFSAGWIIGFMMRPHLVPDQTVIAPSVAPTNSTLSETQKVTIPPVDIILSDTENILKNLIELSIQKSGKKSSPRLFFSALNKSFWNKKDESGLIKSFVIPAKDMNKFFQKKYFSLILEVFPDKASADKRLKEWREKERKYNPYLLEAKDFAGKSHFVLILDDYDNFEKVKNADLNTNINEKKFGLIAYADTDKPLRKFGISWTDDENILHPYTLRVASFRTKKEADGGFKYYTDSGLSPYMVNLYSKKGGGNQWVVYTGPYQSRKEAVEAKKKLPKAVKSNMIPRGLYSNYIDVFYDEQEAEKMCEQLLGLKYSPYIVRKDDVFKVFVGHHKQRKTADTDNEKLKKSGIESRVVAR